MFTFSRRVPPPPADCNAEGCTSPRDGSGFYCFRHSEIRRHSARNHELEGHGTFIVLCPACEQVRLAGAK